LAIDRVDQCVASLGGLKRADHDLLDVLVSDRPRTPRTWLVDQTIHAALGEPPTPARDRRPAHPEPLGDLGVRPAVSGLQHDP